MAKYRFMKETSYITGKSFYYTEKRTLMFFWCFVPGTLVGDYETGRMYFDNVCNHAKSVVTRIV